MTIDPFPCYERDVHVKPTKSFYPLKIPNGHNQLRHLICSPAPNQIYYVDNRDVWCLNPTRGRRTHVTELSFDPSCTAAAHGWFCVGGHRHGHFFSVRLPEAAPDGSNPMLDLFNQSNPTPFLHSHHEQLGSAITNSVSIHRLPRLHVELNDDEEDDEQESEDTVALITNNDHTVRLYSLEKRAELARLEFEYPMNHATISPDGTLMLIVGDQQYAFVYERVPSRMATGNDNVGYWDSEWLLLRKLALYKPSRAEISGYFTTAWSYSGALCATASELGYVTVIDTAMLRQPDVDPVVALVPSSRPMTTPGAIRSMCFSPEPFDLLFWSENNGRVCVADLRAGLRARQIVQLDPAGDGVTQIETIKINRTLDDPELRDFDLEIDFIRRHQRELGDDGATRDMSLATEYLAASAERRRLQRESGGAGLVDEEQGLTEQERQVIEGIRTSRQLQHQYQEAARQREVRHSMLAAAEQLGTGSGSNRRPSSQSINYSAPSRRRHQGESLMDATDELTREHSTLSSIRDYLNSRLDESSRMDALSAIAQHRIRRLEGNPSASSSRPSSSNPPNNGNTSDPWRTIEAAMRAAAPSGSANPASTSNSTNRPSRQQVQDSDSDSMPELERTNSTSNTVAGGRTSSTRVTLPSLRGSSAAYLDSERRRMQDSANSAGELTTRGQAMYARQREADRQRSGENAESAWRAVAPGRGLDAHLLRRMAAGTRTMGGDTAGIYVTGDGWRRSGQITPDGIDDSNVPVAEWGLGTTGISWGDGGRLLYVGTEEGIFELKIDLQQRNFWPAINPR